MGNTVTAAAGAEFFQHLFRVWFTVTVNTSLDCLVLVRMAEGAGQEAVLGLSPAEHFPGLAVAKGAHGPGRLVGVGNLEYLVGRVTVGALDKGGLARHHSARGGHRALVFLVTFQTVGDMTVF